MTTEPAESGDPAPLLPALHQAQERDGHLTREALEGLAASSKTPVIDLYRVATFYHYLSAGEEKPLTAGVCRGPVCSLPGATSSQLNKASISCPGLCDSPVAEYAGGRFSSLSGSPEAFSLPMPVNTEEALFGHIRTPGIAQLEAYRDSGGYQRLLTLVRDGGVSEALDTLHDSGLTGRGGAAFPLAIKLRATREAQATPKYIVCNADEGEPGTFKDRPLLHLTPHLLLEAMAIAGYITGAETGVIYLRYEYPQAFQVLAKAIREGEEAGLLGSSIIGSNFQFRVHLRRGAGSYVCGEETALLNSLEGKVPWPRERPPFPTDHGLWGKPTVINNVETLCFVPLILENGADWFRSLGRNGNAGTKVYSVSGKVRRPGNYELPMGVTARELIFDYAGGPPTGRQVLAFTLGGVSGGLLGADLLDLPLDYRMPQQHGFSLGSGGIIVLDDTCCIVDFVRSSMLFYEAESCGKCFPCRVGTVRLRERLDGLTGRSALPPDTKAQVAEIGAAMAASSACGLGQAAPLVMKGMFQFFSEEVLEHLERRHCRSGICPL